MYANLFGDFVKGSDLSNYSPIVLKGIKLHRNIDKYIDNHPAVIDLMHQLYPHLPKVSGIAVDLFFDHLLAKKWSNFHTKPLDLFLEEFYQFDIGSNNDYTPEFREFVYHLKTKKWISYYSRSEGLERMCNGVSKRISFPNSLKDAPPVFYKFEKQIDSAFSKFMTDAIPHFKEYLALN